MSATAQAQIGRVRFTILALWSPSLSGGALAGNDLDNDLLVPALWSDVYVPTFRGTPNIRIFSARALSIASRKEGTLVDLIENTLRKLGTFR